MHASAKFSQKESAIDRTTLSASAKVDEELLSKMVDPEIGLLKPGAMPSMPTANAGGCKKLLDAVSKATLRLKLKGLMAPPDSNQRTLFKLDLTKQLCV